MIGRPKSKSPPLLWPPVISGPQTILKCDQIPKLPCCGEMHAKD